MKEKTEKIINKFSRGCIGFALIMGIITGCIAMVMNLIGGYVGGYLNLAVGVFINSFLGFSLWMNKH